MGHLFEKSRAQYMQEDWFVKISRIETVPITTEFLQVSKKDWWRDLIEITKSVAASDTFAGAVLPSSSKSSSRCCNPKSVNLSNTWERYYDVIDMWSIDQQKPSTKSTVTKKDTQWRPLYGRTRSTLSCSTLTLADVKSVMGSELVRLGTFCRFCRSNFWCLFSSVPVREQRNRNVLVNRKVIKAIEEEKKGNLARETDLGKIKDRHTLCSNQCVERCVTMCPLKLDGEFFIRYFLDVIKYIWRH